MLLNSRIVNNLKDIPPDTIILCHSNENVEKFNRKRIVESEGNLVINTSVNYAIGPDSK